MRWDEITVYIGSCKLHDHHAIPSAISLVIQSAWQLLETKWTVKLTFCCSEEDGKFCVVFATATPTIIPLGNGLLCHLSFFPMSLTWCPFLSLYPLSPLINHFTAFHTWDLISSVCIFIWEKNPQTSEHVRGHPLYAADPPCTCYTACKACHIDSKI